MVFSDTGDLQGAFYDNNSGVDYHVPVSGSSASPPRLRITHISVEMAPIAKVVFPCRATVMLPPGAGKSAVYGKSS